jgi:hypothetical protein
LFTKAYRQFCDEIINYDFQHHPELIVNDEQTKNFALQYVSTLVLYQEEFGVYAPNAIWSIPKFNEEQLEAIKQLDYTKTTRKKARTSDTTTSSGDIIFVDTSDAPLYESFPYDAEALSPDDGGSFDGGGAGSDFGSDGNDSGNDGSSSDSGSSDSGSSCSSGCGGCGGGGD